MKLVYTSFEGRVTIIPVDSRVPQQDYIDFHLSIGNTDAVIVDEANFPDLNFIEAWELSGSTVSVNMTNAKEVRRNQLRTERIEHFKETDTLMMETWSQHKDTSTIETRQAYLRDITEDPAIDAATTTTQLDAVTIASWTPPVVKDVDTCDYKHTSVNSATYSLTSNDYLIGVLYTSSGTVTLTLPEISTIGMKKYLIVDEGGNASTNNITVNTSGSDTINGQSSYIINTDYSPVAFYNNGSGWFIASST